MVVSRFCMGMLNKVQHMLFGNTSENQEKTDSFFIESITSLHIILVFNQSNWRHQLRGSLRTKCRKRKPMFLIYYWAH